MTAFRDQVNPALVQGAAAPEPENPDQLDADAPDRHPVATVTPHHASLPQRPLRRHTPKAGAQCGNPARWDLRGGPPVRAVPTATRAGRGRPHPRCGPANTRLRATEASLS